LSSLLVEFSPFKIKKEKEILELKRETNAHAWETENEIDAVSYLGGYMAIT
jgi:hypothetical protein